VKKMGAPKYINIASRAKIAFAVNSSRDPQFLRSVAGRPKLGKAFIDSTAGFSGHKNEQSPAWESWFGSFSADQELEV
jgi:hypothetical protein